MCGWSSSVAPSATPYMLSGPSRSSCPPKNSCESRALSSRGYGPLRSRAYPGRIRSSLARSDAAVSSAVSVTSRSFVPRILTVTLASLRTHRRTTALWVKPSSKTVDASSSTRPAHTALRSPEVSPAATSRSLGPDGSSRSAPAASVLMSATVCVSSSGVQYSRSRGSPSSLASEREEARMQMYRRSPSFIMSSRYSAGGSTTPTSSSSSILGRFAVSGSRSVRVVAAEGSASKPKRVSAGAPGAAAVRLSAASRSSLSVSEVTTWLRSTSTGADAPFARKTRISGGGGGGGGGGAGAKPYVFVCGLVCVTSGEVGESIDSLPAAKTRCAPPGVEGVPSPFGANANASSSSNSSSVSSSRSAARSDEWWPCITSGAVRLRRDALRAREVPGPVFICGKSMGAVGVGRGSATVNIAAGGRARRKNCARARGGVWGANVGAVPRSVGRRKALRGLLAQGLTTGSTFSSASIGRRTCRQRA